jgi:hypothetical protein
MVVLSGDLGWLVPRSRHRVCKSNERAGSTQNALDAIGQMIASRKQDGCVAVAKSKVFVGLGQ